MIFQKNIYADVLCWDSFPYRLPDIQKSFEIASAPALPAPHPNAQNLRVIQFRDTTQDHGHVGCLRKSSRKGNWFWRNSKDLPYNLNFIFSQLSRDNCCT